MATTNLLTDVSGAFPFDWPEIGTSSSGTDSSLEPPPHNNPPRSSAQSFSPFYSTNNFAIPSLNHPFHSTPQEPNSYLFTPLDITAAPTSYPSSVGLSYSGTNAQDDLNCGLSLEPSAKFQLPYSERISYSQNEDVLSSIIPPSAPVLSPLSPSSASSLPDSARPRLSPVSIRTSNDLPGSGTFRFDPPSQPQSPQTALPEGSPTLNVQDNILTFDSTAQNNAKRQKTSQSSDIDPHAAAFLKSQLGDEKWGIFSARLYERRLGRGQTQPRARGKKPAVEENDSSANGTGASAIDYLVKVEVVKEVLRTYVPHPYNPFKSLSHPFPDSPSGFVTLTRSTILALSGWSNTQLSYWIRRCEALSMFSEDEPRLKAVAQALQRRLYPSGSPKGFSDITTLHTFSSPSSPVSPITSPLSPVTSRTIRTCPSLTPHPDFPDPAITGKGLDQLIDAVKKRTGKSPFLRGRHASLDPFGLPGSGYGADAHNHGMDVTSPAGTEASFQAKLRIDEGQGMLGEGVTAANRLGPGKRKRRMSEADSGVLGGFPYSHGGRSGFMGEEVSYDFDADADAEGETDDGLEGGFDISFFDGAGNGRLPFAMSSARASMSETLSLGSSADLTSSYLGAPGNFTISDSRLQPERKPRKRANTGTF